MNVIGNRLKYIFILNLLFFFSIELAFGTISICSWNIENLGNSKSDVEIDFMATTIQDFDVIAIQEVVAGAGGAQAVARLVDEMNRKGKKWDYAVSDPTFSSSYKTERYAFIWNRKTVMKLGDFWLDNRYAAEIDREPYFATFSKEGKEFTVVNFHAKTKTKQPETDIKYFKFFPGIYSRLNLIFCGDFNCPQSHTVFNPLKSMGYKPALTGQKTSLRMKCIEDDCLASEFDNFYYDSAKVLFSKSGAVHFYQRFSSLEEARGVSDHIPIFMTFE